MSLRGVATITAVTVLAEFGDLTRFDSPRQWVGFLGLAPSEHSSGSRRRQGATTKTGKGHVRSLSRFWVYALHDRSPAQRSSAVRRVHHSGRICRW